MDSANMTEEPPDVLVMPTLTSLTKDESGRPSLDGTIDVILLPVEAHDGGERVVAIAFTTVARLVEAMGENQPWVIVPTREAEKALEGSGAQAVLVDPQLAPGTVGGAPNG